MATEAQIRANRINARKSTGPRTDSGKQAVRITRYGERVMTRRLLLGCRSEV